MNFLRTLLLVGLSLSGLSTLQAVPLEDQIKEIRARYEVIEAGEYRKEHYHFKLRDEPLSGKATLFFDGKEVIKVELEWGAGDHRYQHEAFYYHRDELVFAYAIESSCSFTGRLLANGDSETSEISEEHRVYFARGEVIRHLVKKVRTDSPEKISELLRKAENTPSNDREKAQEIASRGKAMRKIRSDHELGTMFKN